MSRKATSAVAVIMAAAVAAAPISGAVAAPAAQPGVQVEADTTSTTPTRTIVAVEHELNPAEALDPVSTSLSEAPQSVSDALDDAGIDPSEVSNVVKLRSGLYEIMHGLIVGQRPEAEGWYDGSYRPSNPGFPGAPKLLITGYFGTAAMQFGVAGDMVRELVQPMLPASIVKPFTGVPTAADFFVGRNGQLLTAGLNVIGLPMQVTYAALVAFKDILASVPGAFAASDTAAGRWKAFTDRAEEIDVSMKASIETSVLQSVGAFKEAWNMPREDADLSGSASGETASTGSATETASTDVSTPVVHSGSDNSGGTESEGTVSEGTVSGGAASEGDSPKSESPQAESPKAESPSESPADDSAPSESSAPESSTESTGSESASDSAAGE